MRIIFVRHGHPNYELDCLTPLGKLQAQAVAEDYCRVQFPDAAPEPVRLAIMLTVSHYYENRDNPDRQTYVTMRIAFENLLYPYRDPSKMF